MSRNAIIAIAVAALAVAAWLIFRGGAALLPPEQAVSQTIDELVAAADARNAGAIVDKLSPDFDSPGIDRQQAKAMITMQLQRGSWSRVFIVDQQVKQENTHYVRAKLTTVLARGGKVDSLEDVIPESAGAFAFDILFRLEDEEWMIYSVTWKRVDARAWLP